MQQQPCSESKLTETITAPTARNTSVQARTPVDDYRSSASRWGRGLGALVALALIWLILLPWLTRHPSVQAMIERNDAAGIDPSAKFYSEHPAVRDFQHEIASAHRRNQAAFWQTSMPEE